MSTPREEGFYFPAEWHPHVATWITFPHNDHSWQGDKLGQMYPEYFDLIRVISTGELVNIQVNDTCVCVCVCACVCTCGYRIKIR
jgi:agmatine deiminase